MKFSRREGLAAAGSLAAMSVFGGLAGCGSDSGGQGPQGGGEAGAGGYDERGPITLARGKDASGYSQEEAKRWNAEHPDEQVTILELPDSADAQRQALVQNAQAKGAEYSVIRIDVVWTAEFAANDWVDEMDPADYPTSQGFLASTMDGVKYYDKLYAMPDATGAGLLYYRKDLLDQVGAQPPKTWDELVEVGNRVKAIRPDIGIYGGQFDKYEGLTVNFAEAISSAGGELISDKTATVDTPEAQAGVEKLVQLFNDGVIPPEAITWKEEQGRQAFQDDKLLFLRNWAFVWSMANKTDGSSKVAGKFDVAPLPGLDGPGTSVLGGNSYAVSKFARNKGTARDYIKFMMSEENQKLRTIATSSPPPLESLYEDPDVVAKMPYFPALKEAILASVPRPVTVSYGDLTLAVQDGAYRIIQRQQPVAPGLQELKAKMDPILAR